jgi:2,4-diketo-3-deoxy-L-fuconate hydrolase
MRLLRFGPLGQERPGALDDDDVLRDLSEHVDDISPRLLSPPALARLASIDLRTLPKVEDNVRIGTPVSGSRKFIAIGLNYADHAAETGQPTPTEPVVFTKAITCLSGPYDDVVRPIDSSKMDWEVELGVVIGTVARCVDEAEALACVAGYCVVNDLSERNFQLERGGSWDKGKGCDTFGPIGPWLVTRDEVPNVHGLDMWLDVNGARMQAGNTRTMIFGVAKIVSYVSHYMTLEPADIITTGTPPGVGMSRQPPKYLNDGDVMELGIARLGIQRQRVIAWRGDRVTS